MGAELMLRHKGIDFDSVVLTPVISHLQMRMLGFSAGTVPALRLDGARVQTTLALSRALDALVPDPPLFPADAARRRAVEDAERWGDEVLQPLPRRLSYAALTRDRSALGDVLESAPASARFFLPVSVLVATSGPLLALGRRINSADDDAVRADLAALPGALDRVDDLLAEGVIGGETANAADFQIAPTVRLLLNIGDARPAVVGRAAEGYARRIMPEYPVEIPPALPAEWRPAPAAG
jgi:glutathione S-transferase